MEVENKKNHEIELDYVLSPAKVVPIENIVVDNQPEKKMENRIVEIKKYSNNQKHNEIDIYFENLDYKVSVLNPKYGKENPTEPKTIQRHILKSLNGICKAGEVTAILGSSGAGKTSLLNLLCKRIGASHNLEISGKISANQDEYSFEKFAQFAGYVMQDDILLETMTVRECFEFVAKLKMKKSEEEKTARVNEILKALRLEHVQNTFVGGTFVKGISGGERQRTSIGYELIGDPQLLFLDEPTSGLDSFTAYLLINLLQNYAHNYNKTIVFTIHQPNSDIFGLFDQVMLMVEGQFIYQGPQSQIMKYFEDMGFVCPAFSNPADYLMSIMHIDSTVNRANFEKYFATYDKLQAKRVLNEITQHRTEAIEYYKIQNPFFLQVSTVADREKKIAQRNPVVFKARIGQSIGMALFTGAIYFQLTDGRNDPISQSDIQNVNGALFFISVAMFMTALNPAVLTFPPQRAVFLREENSRLYSVGSYFLGKSLIDFPISIIVPVIYAVIVYWMIGLNDKNSNKVGIFIFVLCLQSLVGNALGVFTGAMFSHGDVAVAFVPMMVLPFMIFGGFYQNRQNYGAWIGWLQYVSPFKYSFEALAYNQYEGTNFRPDPIITLDFEMGIWNSIYVLIAMFFGYRFIAFLMLYIKKSQLQ